MVNQSISCRLAALQVSSAHRSNTNGKGKKEKEKRIASHLSDSPSHEATTPHDILSGPGTNLGLDDGVEDDLRGLLQSDPCSIFTAVVDSPSRNCGRLRCRGLSAGSGGGTAPRTPMSSSSTYLPISSKSLSITHVSSPWKQSPWFSSKKVGRGS